MTNGWRDLKSDLQKSKFWRAWIVLFELRFFFGPGYRIYYTIKGNIVVILLTGGSKTTQAKDIKKATALLNDLEE